MYEVNFVRCDMGSVRKGIKTYREGGKPTRDWFLCDDVMACAVANPSHPDRKPRTNTQRRPHQFTVPSTRHTVRHYIRHPINEVPETRNEGRRSITAPVCVEDDVSVSAE